MLRADVDANTDSFGKLAVVLYRLSQRVPVGGGLVTAVLRVVCGLDLPRTVRAGAGLRLAHGGRGTVVHPDVVLGSRVTLYHGVTLGVSGPVERFPRLGDDVYVGTGACVLGGVTVGDGARIGANAVVLRDVPAGATAVGVPAVVRPAATDA